MKTLGYVNYGTGRVKPFNQIFGGGVDLENANDDEFKQVAAVVVWGGADISPTIYGEPVSRHTGADEKLSHRDEVEVELCERAIKFGIPIIGICRGAQLACAMAGGKLVQDVTGHGGDHLITTNDGRELVTSSIHHQMMWPWGVNHELIAWSKEARSRHYLGGNDQPMTDGDEFEPEIVYFPKIKALAIQGHPEFMDEHSEFVQYCLDLTKKYLLGVEASPLLETSVNELKAAA